jgi:succinate dehydrogenase/fumarate reductase cytochrome b subunit
MRHRMRWILDCLHRVLAGIPLLAYSFLLVIASPWIAFQGNEARREGVGFYSIYIRMDWGWLGGVIAFISCD